MNADYLGLFRALLPEAILVAGALAVLLVDLTLGRSHSLERRKTTGVILGLLALAGAAAAILLHGATGPVFAQAFMFDRLATATRLGTLALAALALAPLTSTPRVVHPAETVAVMLFATVGFLLMGAANQLLVSFVSLELASLSLYLLAGFDKSRPESAEAGLKYFLVGGMSAAFLLFGFSLLFGLTGHLTLGGIAGQLALQGPSPLLLVALVMVLVAFGFKAAAAPFHLWAPDVYQGAPAPAAALIASASKLAGLVFFTRLLWPALSGQAGTVAHWPVTIGWGPVVALIATASLLVGNFGALAQSNVRRLLAYSAIAHAGVMLLGVLAAGRTGVGALYFYTFTYGIATVGSFGVIAAIEACGPAQSLGDLAGLYRRSPLLAGCLAIFILSLAGIPPLAGFFGKFAVFASVLRLGGISGPAGWLVIAAIALSAVALYYYLLILKQALVAKPAANATPIKVSALTTLALVSAAAVTVVLGIMPSWLLSYF